MKSEFYSNAAKVTVIVEDENGVEMRYIFGGGDKKVRLHGEMEAKFDEWGQSRWETAPYRVVTSREFKLSVLF